MTSSSEKPVDGDLKAYLRQWEDTARKTIKASRDLIEFIENTDAENVCDLRLNEWKRVRSNFRVNADQYQSYCGAVSRRKKAIEMESHELG